MEISKEMIIDILENLSDDELRLFLEHLVNNNSYKKSSLFLSNLINELLIKS